MFQLIIPNDIWKGFHLDNWIYIAAHHNLFGWWYQFILRDFYGQIAEYYSHGHIFYWTAFRWFGHPECALCGFCPIDKAEIVE